MMIIPLSSINFTNDSLSYNDLYKEPYDRNGIRHVIDCATCKVYDENFNLNRVYN
jgi:hypothetical protein